MYEHRKVRKKVRFVDAKGVAIANQNVQAKLENHKFLFGCGAFDTLPATAQGDPKETAFYKDRGVSKK